MGRALDVRSGARDVLAGAGCDAGEDRGHPEPLRRLDLLRFCGLCPARSLLPGLSASFFFGA